MIPRRNQVEDGGFWRKVRGQRNLTDPLGLVLLLGSTVAMMAVALIKAQGLPSKGLRGSARPL